ncbi:sodium:proton exchanger [Actinomadura verrucosospora]|uniref:Sodium/calcium exchanger membrane region n=1 Tax=Actinomadura verrucosospora TaxID=46165 RepID=A0A7D3VX74_ACTVE|nr:sodium:proton exchanger [Actinomadura verrucosospora]QKG23114.1 sodium/calcium exchanger membrane region [Actinomadura verrucosospora]
MPGDLVPRETLLVRIGAALAIALPAVATRAAGLHPPAVAAAVIYGAGVLAAAVLLMWAAETARADMSGALALALLALIAILPEYAVDVYYAYAAGTKPHYAGYAAANMTGANRLLVGVGWALVVLAFTLGVRRASRRAGRHGRPPPTAERDVRLAPHHRTELGFLALAAVLGFIPALTAEIGWYIAIVLIALYAVYLGRIARGGGEDVENLAGVPAWLVTLPRRMRRTATGAGFAIGAILVFISAEPFANALVDAGSALGIDEFLLVQWLAPLASEAPELIVAVVFAWRLRDADAIGALLSSKVNQWTLLIGSLPLAYKAGGGGWSLPLDSRQLEEVLLTASQTVLGLGLLIDLVLRRWEAALLFALFAVQFALPGEQARLVLSGVYLAIGFTVLINRYRDLGRAMEAVVRR